MQGDSSIPSEQAAAAWLEVGHGHRLHTMVAGRTDGIPAVLLHGGPGSGSSPRQRGFLDAARYRIVQFDQRGSGSSEPRGEIAHNHTQSLIHDIERLRVHLGIERWLVCGGSWGAALALAYAAQHRERVSGLILRGMFLADKADLDWFFHGAGALAPAEHAEFMGHIPSRWRRRVVMYLDRQLSGPEPDACARLAGAWQRYELALSGADIVTPASAPSAGDAALCAKYKVQAHYLARRCFLGRHALLKAAASLQRTPIALIHGTLDRICRPLNAWRVHRSCSGSRLAWAQGAGHDPFHPATQSLLQRAAATFAQNGDFSRWPGKPEAA